MIKINQYSTIRAEPKHKPQDGYSWSGFYDGILKPSTLLLTIAGYLVLVQKDDLPNQFELAASGDTNSLVHLVLIVLSVIVGARLIQSLYLAKRDYLHLDSSSLDFFSFGILLLFTTGAIVTFIGKSSTVLILYAIGALIGTLHFYALYRFRIPKNSDAFDYPIERKIQIFNSCTFAYLTTVTGYAAWHIYSTPFPSFASCLILASGCVPVILNMIHSDQLTLLPKFLFKNDPDSPKQQVEVFRKAFWRSTADKSDNDIERLLLLAEGRPFLPLKTARASRADVPRICQVLLDEFGYIFEYVFNTTDRKTNEEALSVILTCAGGLGSFGYMSFYMLKSKDDEVGFVCLDTYHNCIIYKLLEVFVLPYRMARIFGVKPLKEISRRSSHVRRLQPEPERGEIRLTYLLISPTYRHKGYGSAALSLLIGALFKSVTNDISAERITLFVRESNVDAMRLCSKAGFRESPSATSPAEDPFVEVKGIGRAVSMEYQA